VARRTSIRFNSRNRPWLWITGQSGILMTTAMIRPKVAGSPQWMVSSGVRAARKYHRAHKPALNKAACTSISRMFTHPSRESRPVASLRRHHQVNIQNLGRCQRH
jgi:hypothetical protein